MIINDFALNFIKQYNRSQKCLDCPNECPETGNCEKCLEQRHWGHRESAYDCPNIRYYYIGHYIHKYSSEIGYVSELEFIKELPKLNILSLGCGPCPDYLGILSILEQKNIKKDIKYFGIELNENWISFHKWIKQKNLSPFNVQYLDVYDFLTNPQNSLKSYQPNILVISYLVSDLLKSGREIDKFIDLFTDNLFPLLPVDSFIIVNDINLGKKANEPRSWYEKLLDSIRKKHKIQFGKYHFRHNYRIFHVYGTQHPSNQILFQIPEELDNFNPWRFCSSAQLIIKKIE